MNHGWFRRLALVTGIAVGLAGPWTTWWLLAPEPSVLAAADAPGSKVIWHEVKRGDTLWALGRAYGTDVASIQRINGLDGTLIKPGQRLLIAPGGTGMYRVKGGDTLWSIAKSQGSTIQDIIVANNLANPDRIAIGDVLLVPSSASVTTKASGEYKAASTGGRASVRLTWPIRGAITSHFGMRDGDMHNGIDIAANHGDEVRAAADGTVASSGWISGYGRTVIIKHASGYRTLYAHLQKALVKAGNPVKQGDLIGLVGSTGNSTGPHLHFEVSLNATRLDPLASLSPQVASP